MNLELKLELKFRIGKLLLFKKDYYFHILKDRYDVMSKNQNSKINSKCMEN